MKRLSLVLVAVAMMWTASAVIAHEQTFTGIVAAIETAKVQVKVTDAKTKTQTSMDFGVTTKTKIYRGDKTVSLADAKIQKDERIAVTIDHDAPGHNATVIRLAVKK